MASSYLLDPVPSRARVSEPAAASVRLAQAVLLHEFEGGLLDPDQHQLGDPVTPPHLVVVLGVVVHQHDVQLAAVAGVDQAGRIETGDAVAHRQAAAREHQAGVPRRDGHRHPRRHRGPSTPAGQQGVGPGDQVGTGVPPAGVAGHRQVGIELMQGHAQHRRTLQGAPTRPEARRPVACPRVLAWIDLEMTGLDPARHTIVEIASLITDDDLAVVEEGPDLVVHASEEQVAGMDEYVRAMHTRSGLLADMEASTLSLADAGAQTLLFLKKHIHEPSTVPLAGNSIGTDRRFLATLLPDIENYLHYRSVDVSTIKELCRRWQPDVYKAAPVKKGRHRALQDIRESVAELAYYRAALFDHSTTTQEDAP